MEKIADSKRTNSRVNSRRRKKRRYETKNLVIVLLLGLLSVVLFFALRYFLFYISEHKVDTDNPYPVKGVDVSSYQGDVNWKMFEQQDIQFAFIKATEGSNHKDVKFKQNWSNISKTGIRKGAYHFVSFDTPGEAQAANFIETVPLEPDVLPPVLDIEMYGSYSIKGNRPSIRRVRRIVNTLLDKLEEHYGVKPIIYTNYSVYLVYLAFKYDDYDIWFSNPGFDIRRKEKNSFWTFCQYSFYGTLKGNGNKHVDLNVFNGSKWEFRNYPKRRVL